MQGSEGTPFLSKAWKRTLSLGALFAAVGGLNWMGVLGEYTEDGQRAIWAAAAAFLSLGMVTGGIRFVFWWTNRDPNRVPCPDENDR